MKKILLNFLTLILFKSVLAAEPPVIKFTTNTITANEKREGITNLKVKIELKGKLDKDVKLKVSPLAIGTATESVDYEILVSDILFKKDEENITKDIFIQINGDTLAEKNETIVLRLITTDSVKIEPDNSIILIDIINAAPEDDSPHAKIFIGSNFDFFDGVSPSNLYSEFNIFIADAINEGWFSKHTIGFYTGFYQNKSISLDSSQRRTFIFEMLKDSPVGVTDSIRNSYNVKTKTEIRNLGLYFAPTYKLYANKTFSIFASLHMEIIQRRFTFENTEYTLLDIDTFKGSGSGISYVPELPKKRTENRYDTYWGTGLPIKLNTNFLEFSCIPFWGLANITTSLSPISGNAVSSRWIGFYGFQFYAIENKTGISLGGEIRGNFGNKSAIITVNLSKSFTLKKIGDFLLKKN